MTIDRRWKEQNSRAEIFFVYIIDNVKQGSSLQTSSPRRHSCRKIMSRRSFRQRWILWVPGAHNWRCVQWHMLNAFLLDGATGFYVGVLKETGIFREFSHVSLLKKGNHDQNVYAGSLPILFADIIRLLHLKSCRLNWFFFFLQLRFWHKQSNLTSPL